MTEVKVRGVGLLPGVVKWFKDAKGYGFIRPAHQPNGADVFVHHSVIEMPGYRTLYQGQPALYEVAERMDGRGLYAVRVVPETDTNNDQPCRCGSCLRAGGQH